MLPVMTSPSSARHPTRRFFESGLTTSLAALTFFAGVDARLLFISLDEVEEEKEETNVVASERLASNALRQNRIE